MRKFLLLFFGLMALLGGPAFAEYEPPPLAGRWVVDTAKMLNVRQQETLANMLREIEIKTGGSGKGAQVAILIVREPQGDIVVSGSDTIRAWRLGQAGYGSEGKSNGVVIMIATGRGQKGEVLGKPQVGVSVGNGFPMLGPALLGNTVEKHFSQGSGKSSFNGSLQGLVKDVAELVYKASKVTSEAPVPKEASPHKRGESDLKIGLFALATLLSGVFGAILHRRGRLLRYWFGGTLGGSSWVALGTSLGVAGVTLGILGAAGYILAYLLSKLFRRVDSFPDFWWWNTSGGSGGSDGGGLRGGGGESSGSGGSYEPDGAFFDSLPDLPSPPSDCGPPDISGCDC
jgi:uncharacterized membrane protein YgcG